MRVASNKLKDLIEFYYKELDGIYEREETEAMLNVAIEHYLGFSRTEILIRSEENINQSVLIKLYDCCKSLKLHIPLQYILEEAWFYDLKFYVNPFVLIPRPETEELVNIILNENQKATSFLDLGTGSGCIPVSIKKNKDEAIVSACDISDEALKIATKNALHNQTDIGFFKADILDEKMLLRQTTQKFDVIVSNPPYIKFEEKKSIAENVIGHEPSLALFVEGKDNIIFYKKIIDLCEHLLNKKGILYFELNPLTAELVKEYAVNSALFKEQNLLKDMSGKFRFLKAIKH